MENIFEEAFMQGFTEGLDKVAAGRLRGAAEAVGKAAKGALEKGKELWRGHKGPGYGRPYGSGEMLKELVGKGTGRVSKGKAAKILGTRAAMVGVPGGAGAVGLGAALRKRKKKEEK